MRRSLLPEDVAGPPEIALFNQQIGEIGAEGAVGRPLRQQTLHNFHSFLDVPQATKQISARDLFLEITLRFGEQLGLGFLEEGYCLGFAIGAGQGIAEEIVGFVVAIAL